MTITVKDLFQYDSNFDRFKIERLTGKKDFKKTDIVNLTRLAALNDKDLSVFVAQKEGKSFVNLIKDDNMHTKVAEASGVGNNNQNQNNPLPVNIPMDKSVFDYQKLQMA